MTAAMDVTFEIRSQKDSGFALLVLFLHWL